MVADMSDFFPHGYVPGCLPRATKFGECCSKFSDRIDVITDEEEYRELIGKTTLRTRLNIIFDQGRIGSCATESTTQSVQLIRDANNYKFVQLNPLSIYHFTSGGRDNGSNIDRNLEHARDVGILPEDVWPRSNGFKARPPQELLDRHACKYRIDEFYDIDGNQHDEIRTALAYEFPVVFGWKGHSCVMVELLPDLRSALFANSYSKRWSDNPFDYPGIGVIRFSQIESRYGLFAVRTTTDPGATP
jgi:hypothetical protein